MGSSAYRKHIQPTINNKNRIILLIKTGHIKNICTLIYLNVNKNKSKIKNQIITNNIINFIL